MLAHAERASERWQWVDYVWISQVTGLRGRIIDPFGKKMVAPRRDLRVVDGLYKTAVRKFNRINMSILLHLGARWALEEHYQSVSISVSVYGDTCV